MPTSSCKEWRTVQCSAPQIGRKTRTWRQRWQPWNVQPKPRLSLALMVPLMKTMEDQAKGGGRRDRRAQMGRTWQCTFPPLNSLPRSSRIGCKSKSSMTDLTHCEAQNVKSLKMTQHVDVNVIKSTRYKQAFFKDYFNFLIQMFRWKFTRCSRYWAFWTISKSSSLATFWSGSSEVSSRWTISTWQSERFSFRKSGEWPPWSSAMVTGALWGGRRRPNWIGRFSRILLGVKTIWDWGGFRGTCFCLLAWLVMSPRDLISNLAQPTRAWADPIKIPALESWSKEARLELNHWELGMSESFFLGMRFLRCSTTFQTSLLYFGAGCKIWTQLTWANISRKRELQTSVRWEAKFLPFCNSPGSFERVFPQLLQDGWSTSVIEKDHEADAIGEVLMFQHTSNALHCLNLV